MRIGIIHDICRVQKPGKKFSPKTAFLDTLDEVFVLKGMIVPPFAIVVYYLYPQWCIAIIDQPQKYFGYHN